MMRIRQRGNPTVYGEVSYSNVGGVCFVAKGTDVLSVPATWSCIADRKNAKDKDGNYPVSPTCHYDRVCKPDSSCFNDTGVNTKRWGATFFKAANYVYLNGSQNTLFSNPGQASAKPPNWDDEFALRAVQSITPSIRPAVQAPVEILELVTGWRGLLKPDFLADLVKGDLVRMASKGNLWYQFGIAPLVGAVKDVRSRLKTFEKDLNSFISHQGKPQKGFYREKISNTDPVQEIGAYHGSRMTVTSHKCTHTAVAIYRYTIPGIKQMSRDLRRLLALADMAGLGAWRGMLWELTPYSFVVDWFYKVGDWLSQFDKPFLDVDCVIEKFTVSSSQERRAKILWLSKLGAICATVGEVTEKLYWRVPWIPSTEWFGVREAGPLSVRKLLLGASLIGVRL